VLSDERERAGAGVRSDERERERDICFQGIGTKGLFSTSVDNIQLKR
jgi:hypothetical protein